MNRGRLADGATAVLEQNWTGSFTVPSRRLYPHQWSWDSAFAAIGWAHVRFDRAVTEVCTLLAAQWPDGRIPHIAFDPAVPESTYFPGPSFWRTGRATSGIVQPPVHAIAARRISRVAGDGAHLREFLHRAYPALCAQQRYFTGHRDVRRRGLVAIVHPWESGRDNAADWDAPLAAVPATVPAEPFLRRDLAGGHPEERPTDADYERYVAIAAAYRDAGYRDETLAGHPFVVECPLVNAVLAAADEALADIAATIGADPAPHRSDAARRTAALVEELYEPVHGFRPLDVRTGKRCGGGVTVAALAPLVVAGLPGDVAAQLVSLAERSFGLGTANVTPLPSQAPDTPGFDRRRYWRGPVWLNCNWLVWTGLRRHGYVEHADRLAAASLGLVERAGFREYFDPFDGTGRGADAFSWSAALVLDLLAECDE